MDGCNAKLESNRSADGNLDQLMEILIRPLRISVSVLVLTHLPCPKLEVSALMGKPFQIYSIYTIVEYWSSRTGCIVLRGFWTTQCHDMPASPQSESMQALAMEIPHFQWRQQLKSPINGDVGRSKKWGYLREIHLFFISFTGRPRLNCLNRFEVFWAHSSKIP